MVSSGDPDNLQSMSSRGIAPLFVSENGRIVTNSQKSDKITMSDRTVYFHLCTGVIGSHCWYARSGPATGVEYFNKRIPMWRTSQTKQWKDLVPISVPPMALVKFPSQIPLATLFIKVMMI